MSLEKVRTMLANQLNVQVDKVKEDSRIVEDLGADSLDMIEMLMALEEEFGITVPDEDAESLKTVGDIVKYIDNAKKEN